MRRNRNLILSFLIVNVLFTISSCSSDVFVTSKTKEGVPIKYLKTFDNKVLIMKIGNEDEIEEIATIPEMVESDTVVGFFDNVSSNVRKIILPKTIHTIVKDAFHSDKTIEYIDLSSIDIIGETAFYNCKNLKKIVFPDYIKYVAPDAFEGCTGVKEVVCNTSYPDFSCENTMYIVLDICSDSTTVYVPKGCSQNYEKTWFYDYNIVEK